MNTEKTYHHSAPETSGRTIPWARFYDLVTGLLTFGKMRALRKTMIQQAQIRPGESVLDVGCGTGDLALAAKALVGPTGAVHGIDASPQMIALAQRKAAKARTGLVFQVGLIEDIAFPDAHFDLVMSTLMMHHLPGDLKRAGLAEIYRVTRPGGRILIVDMQSSSSGSLGQQLADVMIQMHGGHAAMHDNVTKLIPLVQAAGFTNLETGKINRQMAFIVAEKEI
ncbi:MAG TPA: methyltransferase domain-containing protein [Anaerolineales bacterium]